MATKKKKSEKMLGWHFLPADLRLEYGDGREVKVGQTLSVPGVPEVCYNGLHASERPSQAASFKRGPVLCRVEVSGSISKDNEKFCGNHRKVLWMKEIKARDVGEIYKLMVTRESAYHSSHNVVERLGFAASSHGAKFDRAIVQFAGKNGCYVPPPPPPRAPLVNETMVMSVLNDRVVLTEHDIKGLLGTSCRYFADARDAFESPDHCDGDSTLTLVLDDLCLHDDVRVIEDYTSSGANGYVLMRKKAATKSKRKRK